MPNYVSVAFNVPINKLWTYKNLPDTRALPGSRVEAVLGRRIITGWVVEESDMAEIEEALIKPYLRLVDESPLLSAEALELAKWLSGMYYCSLGEALAVMSPSAEREPKRQPDAPRDAGVLDELRIAAMAPVPSEEQKAALAEILAAKAGRWYLYGPTGTGKTEVFLEAAEATLKEGRGVIYLVPEIALTKQVIDAVKQRFGENCAVLHSGLGPQKRLAEWKRIQSGKATVLVGARSAIFAPLKNLGLIVLDEEHEGSYKAGSSPRYHARQVAMKRAATEKARLLMGSATPSVEAWKLMQDCGIKKLVLSRRLAGGDMPSLEIVDMRLENGSFSRRLVEAIRKTKKEGGQTILFLNRRGFSHFWSCKSCGAELKCMHCSVGLTYHKEKKRMLCHYCGYQIRLPDACPECGSLDTGWAGFGTEQVEEEAARLFPDLSLARLDADTVNKKGVLDKTLDDFRNGKTDLLLGTQMVAKGLNFPGVKLVGIILADTALNLPDFRGVERTFSLVTQVAGRAGRFSKGGRVIIQTFRPSSPVLLLAATNNVDSFYAEELAVRKMLGFPPYTRLIRLLVRSKKADAAEAGINGLAEKLMGMAGYYGVEVLGPSECPLSMIAGNYRRQLILRSGEPGPARSLLNMVLAGFKLPSGSYLEIDPDPVSLL
ncbi:primosomal protein N' [Spirochaetota bacterium]